MGRVRGPSSVQALAEIVPVKEYGTPDADPTAYQLLLSHVQGMAVVSILHYPRVAIDARPCQLPLSLRVQAVLANGVVITSWQPSPGRPARIET